MTRSALLFTAVVAACTRSTQPPPVTQAATPVAQAAPQDASVAEIPQFAHPQCRNDLPPAAPLRLEPSAYNVAQSAQDPSGPLATACQRLSATTAALYHRVRRGTEEPTLALYEGIGQCLPAGRGAWAFEVASLAAGVSEGQTVFNGRWRLVYLDTAGRKVTSQISGELTLRGQGTHRPTRGWIHDLDHDGVGEIHFISETDYGEEQNTDGRWSMTVHEGAVQPFAPLANVVCDQPADVDGDSVVDFLVSPPYRIPVPGLNDDQTQTGLSMVLHGRPNLTWVSDDEVAHEFVRQRCAAAPGAPPYYHAPGAPNDALIDDAITRMTCARFQDISVLAIERALRAELGATDPDAGAITMFNTSTLGATLNALRPDPPFIVESRCPPAR